MKRTLIILNFVLLVLVLWGFAANLRAGAKRNTKSKSVNTTKTARTAILKNQTGAPVAAPALPEIDKAAETVASVDIFNNVRSPLANSRSGRIDMTLLGTFKIGKVEGAIIRQRGVQRQFNPYLMAMMRAGGMGPGGGMMPPPPGGMPGGGMPGGGMPGGGMPGGAQGGTGTRGGRGRGFSNWSALGRNGSGNTAQTTFKQYVRVGETLSNGYTLSEVTRTTATLVRGNDKMELELLDPSKNRTSNRSSGTRQLNANQQFQQAQMIMQSQMMRTMMQMQRNQGGGGGNASPRGRR